MPEEKKDVQPLEACRFVITDDGNVIIENLTPAMLEIAQALNPDDEELAFRQHCMIDENGHAAESVAAKSTERDVSKRDEVDD